MTCEPPHPVRIVSRSRQCRSRRLGRAAVRTSRPLAVDQKPGCDLHGLLVGVAYLSFRRRRGIVDLPFTYKVLWVWLCEQT